jgi:hypothetical protein
LIDDTPQTEFYIVLVVSKAVTNSETWALTSTTCTAITKRNEKWLRKISPTATYDILANIHRRRLAFIGHIMRSEPPPRGSNYPPQSPTFRLLILRVKHIEGSINCPAHLNHLDPLDPNGGYNPHAIDFTIDIPRTFTKGSLFELVPKVNTFRELLDMFRQGDTPKEQKLEWRRQSRAIVDQWASQQ